MAAETFDMKIEGYWIDSQKDYIRNHSGVYFVYECTYNEANSTVNIQKLIYIGESEEVRERIVNHEKYHD